MNELRIEKPEGQIRSVGRRPQRGGFHDFCLLVTLSIVSERGNPIGSLTQMGTIRIGARRDNNFPFIKDFVPLADARDLVFGGWDIYEQSCHDAAVYAHVLDEKDINLFRDELKSDKADESRVRSILCQAFGGHSC